MRIRIFLAGLIMMMGAGITAELFGISSEAYAISYDFTYFYSDPSAVNSSPYVQSKSNVRLMDESPVRYWEAASGGSTLATTTPGVILYHFGFASAIGEAFLRTNNPTYHWFYSEGHNYLWGSKDEINWVNLLDVGPPAYGGANGGVYNANLPATLLGGNDLWIKVEMYSYGPEVNGYSGYGSNTAQHSRWLIGATTAHTFELDVNYAKVVTHPVPEPTTLLLVGTGLAALVLLGRKKLSSARIAAKSL